MDSSDITDTELLTRSSSEKHRNEARSWSLSLRGWDDDREVDIERKGRLQMLQKPKGYRIADDRTKKELAPSI